ncbi:MAG: HAMP domain-containing histidine kinase [Clostridia bacterium]|nr:HAMP domain-containing histidine kinase [Clostridia bacterium]
MKTKDLLKTKDILKAKDFFKELRKNNTGWFTLNTRLTLLVGAVVLGSILIAFGIVRLIELFFPTATALSFIFQLSVFSLAVAMIATHLLSKIFFNPIKDIREGMEKVANGEFDTQLSTTSSALEIQELFAGFNMMTQELSSTEILQTDFVSNVSHEFKTPINAIEGYSTLLQDCDNLDKEQCEYVEKILFNTRRLSSLVSNILLLSKLENQSIQTHKEYYALDEQVREAIVALEPMWTCKNIDLDVELARIEYFGNENMMYHVWTNLISNAIKFSPDGGTVKIRLSKDEKICFIVEDKGKGLSEEAKRHIFDKFYQGDTSHKDDGNGLGLTLVKNILKIAEGEIFAKNIEGGGCRFTVTL